MNEIIKLDEIGHQMERGLDGLGLFLDTWDGVSFTMQDDDLSQVFSVNHLAEIAESDAQIEALHDLWANGHAYLAGWNTVLGILDESLRKKREKEAAEDRAAEMATHAANAASPSQLY